MYTHSRSAKRSFCITRRLPYSSCTKSLNRVSSSASSASVRIKDVVVCRFCSMVLPLHEAKIMSLHQEISASGEDMSEFYDTLGTEWTGIDTPAFQTAFMSVNAPYCAEPTVPPATLTPISLPDSSFRPSPALSPISQEYTSQDYRYNINDCIQPQGLGISAPFPSEYPRTTAPNVNYIYSPGDLQYGMGHTPNTSPQGPPVKRMKRTSPVTPCRDIPVNILPHPDSVQRMECERQSGYGTTLLTHPQPRAPGRGRRDPQAEVEDAFVEGLREQNLAWKVVREMFRQRFNKDASEARLQMRLLRRRKERLARWDDHDVQLLINAHEMWKNEKYRFISDRMKELGSTKDHSPEQCRAQLRLLEAKQAQQDMGGVSPSAVSDPPHTPSIQPVSRKRARASWDELDA